MSDDRAADLARLTREPLIKRVALPRHVNPHNHVLGCWVVEQMDYACGVVGETVTGGPIATLTMRDIVFLQPLFMGDFVSVYCREYTIGNTSLTIQLEVIGDKPADGRRLKAVTGTFVMVAIDGDGKPRTIER